MIESWNVNPLLELPEYNPNPNDEVNEGDLQSIMKSISSADKLEDQKFNALRLRQLTETNPSIRAEFGESGDNVAMLIDAISRADALSKSQHIWYIDMIEKRYDDLAENEIDDIDTSDKDLKRLHDDLRENLIATITSVSIHSDNIKKSIAETPDAVQLLVNAMHYRGREELRTTAVVAIRTLCSLDSNKILFAKAEKIFKYLTRMFDFRDGLVLKAAFGTILSLWSFLDDTESNSVFTIEPSVKAHVIKGIIKLIEARCFLDDVLEFLARLSIHDDATEKMVMYDATTCLFYVLRKNPSLHTKENCAVILHAICCKKDHRTLIEMRSEEKSRRTLSRLVEGGTPRAIIKVNGILERLKE
ncbi:U-box domain-containing protein 9-like isoform X2 [Salvia splendens]|nr:U-box domain-containing protein 9-like isoform X2 [Salvia splendens]XP_041995259.1 U-box domain-containing protein 9-like isoform X2 [Salvia splendens]XP_041995260.1 U-box domain-containing protein 9-like isoform X2 [Salvia splendens]